MYNDDYLKQFIEAAKCFYFLEQLKERELTIKRHGKRHDYSVDMFDKLKMFLEGREPWEIAAHYGKSIPSTKENINRARFKVSNFIKLFHKGLA